MLSRRRFHATGLAVGLSIASSRGVARFLHPGVDLRTVRPGRWTLQRLDGVEVCIRHRAADEIRVARATRLEELAHAEADQARVVDPAWIVVDTACPHAGCRTLTGLGAHRGWLCLCHGSDFDLSGRVRAGPARANLAVIPHRIVEGTLELLPRNDP